MSFMHQWSSHSRVGHYILYPAAPPQSAEHCEMADSESEYKFNPSSIVITVIKSLGSQAIQRENLGGWLPRSLGIALYMQYRSSL